MTSFAITVTSRVELIALAAFVVWIVLAGAVAEYGHGRGFPWWPLFLCGLFLSWPLVLLAVTIGAGPRKRQGPPPQGRTEESQRLVDLARITGDP